MQLNYLAFAIPGFLLLMGLEYLVARRQGKSYFTYADSVLNISVGIGERLLNLFITGFFHEVFVHLHTRYALLPIPENAFTWLLLFLLVDFVWYWYHRFGHEVSLFWSAHIVHHQSEEFNYTVSARITVFQAFIRTGFWCVLPLLGFPAHMLTVMLLIHGAYAFFLHTRLVGKLGWLEHVLVTPSHHRVHHAANPQYVDKNYSDMLIIWDKLFGTFAQETEPPVYGLTKPLKSHSFLWQHFHFALELWAAVRHTSGGLNRLNLLFGKPERVPATFRPALEARFLSQPLVTSPVAPLRGYVSAQLMVSLIVLFVFTLLEAYLNIPVKLAGAAAILITLVNCGAILEQRTWIFYLEYVRLILVLVAAFYYFHTVWVPAGLGVGVAVITLYFTTVQRTYFRLVYGVPQPPPARR